MRAPERGARSDLRPVDGTDHGPSRDEPEPLGQQSPEIVADAAEIGGNRLARPAAGDLITGFIGGMSVSFGVVAMAWAAASFGRGMAEPSAAHLAGSLAFPVGFLILLVGKSELFTENFFLPVAAVLARRGTPRQLGALWAASLVANLAGALIFAVLISRPGVLDHAPAQEVVALATHKVDGSFWREFVSAIFAGWLMTMLTWLLVAAKGFGPRLFIIWAMGALIILGQFNHVVISAAESFMALFLGAPFGVWDWFSRNLIPALLGNVVGGVIFVTLLHYVQAQVHEPTT